MNSNFRVRPARCVVAAAVAGLILDLFAPNLRPFLFAAILAGSCLPASAVLLAAVQPPRAQLPASDL